MILYVFVNIILIFIFNPGLSVSMLCTLKVTQPQELLHGRFNQSVHIPCHVNTSCPPDTPKAVQWFVFRTNSYQQLDINNHPMKYRLIDTGLQINMLSHQDDGVYYCTASYKTAANSGAQDIGSGTTLTLKDNGYSIGQVLLLTLVVLLSLYSLIILTLFICVKTGRVKLLKERQSQSKTDSTRRVHFGAVVQELYSKRNLRRNKKNTSAEVAQKNKIENSQPQKRREDIYQNLKRAR